MDQLHEETRHEEPRDEEPRDEEERYEHDDFAFEQASRILMETLDWNYDYDEPNSTTTSRASEAASEAASDAASDAAASDAAASAAAASAAAGEAEELKLTWLEWTKREFENEPIPESCVCKKIYNWYEPTPCLCTEDMRERNKVCVSCHATQMRSCHRSCGEGPIPTYTISKYDYNFSDDDVDQPKLAGLRGAWVDAEDQNMECVLQYGDTP